jgi:hypothetical protein
MGKQRVFVGVLNTGGLAASMAAALRAAGVHAVSFSYSAHPFGYSCDHERILFIPRSGNRLSGLLLNRYVIRLIRLSQKIRLFISCLFQYHTFVFISTQSFFSDQSDLRILHLLRKKICFVFVGCPERDPQDPLNLTDRGYCSFCRDEQLQKQCLCREPLRKQQVIRNIERHSDIIFSARDTSGYLRNKSILKKLFVIDRSDPQEDFLHKFADPRKIIISHFPTNKLLKNTGHVEDIIRSIPDERLEYCSVRLSNNEVHVCLEKTHILVDQFGSMHGLLAVEAMARGCVVICRLSRWFREDHPEIPVISCEPEELRDVLLDLLDHPDKMQQIAVDSIAYYRKYHSPQAAGAYYKAVLHL